MKKQISGLVVLALSLALVGCGSDSKPSGGSAATEALKNRQGLLREPKVGDPLPISVMNGKYVSPCESEVVSGSTLYAVTRLELNYLSMDGNILNVSQDLYTDSGCTDLRLSMNTKGTFSLSNGSTHMDVTNSKTTITPRIPHAATALNNSSACGHTNWTSQQGKDFTQGDCHQPQYRLEVYSLDAQYNQIQTIERDDSSEVTVFTKVK